MSRRFLAARERRELKKSACYPTCSLRALRSLAANFKYVSQPSHRKGLKMVGSLTGICHTTDHEKHQTSNRLKILCCASALQLHSAAFGAPVSPRHRRRRTGQDLQSVEPCRQPVLCASDP